MKAVVILIFLLVSSGFTSFLSSTGQAQDSSVQMHPFSVKCSIAVAPIVGDLNIMNESGTFNLTEFTYDELVNGYATRNISITGIGMVPFYVWLGYVDGGSLMEPEPPFVFLLVDANETFNPYDVKLFNPNFGNETRQAQLVIVVTGSPYYGKYAFELDFFTPMRGDVQPAISGGDDRIDMLDLGFAAHEFSKTQDRWGQADFALDFDRNGIINMIEIQYIASHFGERLY